MVVIDSSYPFDTIVTSRLIFFPLFSARVNEAAQRSPSHYFRIPVVPVIAEISTGIILSAHVARSTLCDFEASRYPKAASAIALASCAQSNLEASCKKDVRVLTSEKHYSERLKAWWLILPTNLYRQMGDRSRSRNFLLIRYG
jgi:hypothetical protein